LGIGLWTAIAFPVLWFECDRIWDMCVMGSDRISGVLGYECDRIFGVMGCESDRFFCVVGLSAIAFRVLWV